MRTGYDQLIEKPWGFYINIYQNTGYKVKVIVIYPREKLSEQRHKHRSELWSIAKGFGLIYKGFNTTMKASGLVEGLNTKIDKMQWHSAENVGEEDLIIVETQLGDYLEEDDIERRADKYGRCDASE